MILIRTLFNSEISDDEDDNWSIWVRMAESIGFIRVFDSAFTTAASLPSTETVEFCMDHEEVLVWVMFIILLALWAGLLVLIMGPGIIVAIREKVRRKIIFDAIVTLGIWLGTFFLLLGGNFKPLACRFDCDIYNSNFTTLCDVEGYHSTRLAIQFTSFCILSVFCVLLIKQWVKWTKRFGALAIVEIHTEEESHFMQDIVLLEFKPLPQD